MIKRKQFRRKCQRIGTGIVSQSQGKLRRTNWWAIPWRSGCFYWIPSVVRRRKRKTMMWKRCRWSAVPLPNVEIRLGWWVIHIVTMTPFFMPGKCSKHKLSAWIFRSIFNVFFIFVINHFHLRFFIGWLTVWCWTFSALCVRSNCLMCLIWQTIYVAGVKAKCQCKRCEVGYFVSFCWSWNLIVFWI